MQTISLDDLEVNVAPAGASDAVGGPFCAGAIFVIVLI